MSLQAREFTYSVPGVSCGHCRAAITQEVTRVPGVGSVEVDLAAKLVTVRGAGLDDTAIRAAIDEAGYDVAAWPRSSKAGAAAWPRRAST